MPKANISHDITIETLADTTSRRGFMLWQNRRSRSHRVRDAQTIQPRQLTMGELTEAESPPEIALFWSQDDWSLGIGGINHKLDPRKLALGSKVESQFGRIQVAAEIIEPTRSGAANNVRATGFAKVGTEVWAFVGRDVYLWTQATVNLVLGAEPAAQANIYRNGVEFNGNTFAPGWDDSTFAPVLYLFKADADADWTVHPNTSGASWGDAKFKYFAKGRNADGDEILWGGYQVGAINTIRSATAPDTDTAATWSSAELVGSSDSEITALVADDDTLLVCKTDGVYAHFSDSTIRNLTPQYQNDTHPDNFRGAFNWNGHILLPLGKGGMVEIVGGEVFDVSMETAYAPEQPSLHGRVVAMSGDATTLFALLVDGTTYRLLMAKWIEFQGRRDFRWHQVSEFQPTSGGVNNNSALFVESVPHSGLTHHRVWVGVDTVDEDIGPQYYTIDSVDNEFTFTNDSATAITTEFAANFAQINKAFQSFDAEINNLGAGGRQILVEYRVDKGSWTALGTLNDTGRNQSIDFADGVTGKIIELRFTFSQTTAGSTSPELLGFRVTGQLRPSRVQLLPTSFYLADEMTLLNGAVEGRVKGNLAQLRTWAGQAAEVIVVDSEGTSRDMLFLPGSLEVQEVGHEFGRRSEYRVNFILAEVT